MDKFNEDLFAIKSDLDLAFKSFNQNKELQNNNNDNNNKELIKFNKEIISLQESIAKQNTKTGILENDLKYLTGNISSISYKDESNEYPDEIINLVLANRLLDQKLRKCKTEDESKKALCDFKDDINSIFNDINEDISSLLEENKKLEDKNKSLKEKFLQIDEITYKPKQCIHCLKSFIPKFNEERSCLYHPGKIKYFSCKGCGDDEYYTCCSKCYNCSQGCKYGKHATEI